MKPATRLGSVRAPSRTVARGTLRPLLTFLLLLACGRTAPREPPPHHGEPDQPAPAAAEPEAAPEQQLPSAPKEEERAAPEASPLAPPPPAPSPGAPPAKSRRPPPNAVGVGRGEDNVEWGIQPAAPSPQRLRQRLDEAVKLATPDCPSARERKQAICDLAEQICQMVERDPDVASVESYCDDARQRCNEAEKRTAQRCD